MRKKMIVAVLALILVCGCVIGSTLAWLTAKTDPVQNTFTVGDITLTLEETTGGTYKMVPGTAMDKDPVVTVGAGSEACWVYVKVEKTGGGVTVGETTYSFDDFLTVTMAAGWTELEGVSGVYWRSVDSVGAEATELPVLLNNKIQTNAGVTKAMLNAITDANKPVLTFTAYAVQKEAGENALAAWQATYGAGEE